MKAVTKETYKIFWRHARKYPWHLGVIVICLVGAVSVESVIPLFYKRFFDLLGSSGGPNATTAAELTKIIIQTFGLWGVVWIC